MNAVIEFIEAPRTNVGPSLESADLSKPEGLDHVIVVAVVMRHAGRPNLPELTYKRGELVFYEREWEQFWAALVQCAGQFEKRGIEIVRRGPMR